MNLMNILNLIIISSFMIQICDSAIISKNHNLGYNLPKTSLVQLCKKLSDPKSNKKCNIVSCIGANNWKQRQFLENNFGLDPKKSSTLSGPLKPRNNLWEDDQPEGYNFLLDSEIPESINDLTSSVDVESLLKLSALSNCILIYLNENDFENTRDELYLNQNVKTFFQKLSKRLDLELSENTKKTKDIYIILPDFDSFQKKVNLKKSQFKSFENTLKEYFPNKIVYVKSSKHRLTLPNYFNTASTVNSNQLFEVLKSFKMNSYLKTSLDYLKQNIFKNYRNFIDESLGKALKGEIPEDFSINYQNSLFDSRMSYYILVMEHLGQYNPTDLVEIFSYHNAKTCLETMLNNLEEQIKSDFVKYYAEHRDVLNIDIVVDQFTHKFKAGLMNIIPTLNSQQFNGLIQQSTLNIKNYMYHINDLYKKFPNNMDSEKKLKNSRFKFKHKDKFSGMLQLVAHFRDRGSGNKSAFLNYKWHPFLLTLGYSNDRNLFGEGTSGKMHPPIKVQPIVHLRWNL